MSRTSKRKPMPTRAQLRKLMVYDPKTGEMNRHKIHKPGRHNAITLNGIRYLKSNIAWVYMHGKIPIGKYVSFIDRNIYNLAIDNLRLVDLSERAQGARLHNTNTSGFRGVCFDWQRSKWLGYIKKDGIRYGARFDTMKQAVDWRQDKEQELFTIRPR